MLTTQGKYSAKVRLSEFEKSPYLCTRESMAVRVVLGSLTLVWVLFFNLLWRQLIAHSRIPLCQDTPLPNNDLFMIQEMGRCLEAPLP